VLIGTSDAAAQLLFGCGRSACRSTCAAAAAHFNFIPGLDKLGQEYVSGAALGPDGYLLASAFVPLGIDDNDENDRPS
jgi:hypothetical protein